MFYLNSTLNFGIPPVMVFQWEVYYMVDRVLTGITAQQKGTTALWYSNKTSLALVFLNSIEYYSTFTEFFEILLHKWFCSLIPKSCSTELVKCLLQYLMFQKISWCVPKNTLFEKDSAWNLWFRSNLSPSKPLSGSLLSLSVS